MASHKSSKSPIKKKTKKTRELWAATSYGNHVIQIFVNHSLASKMSGTTYRAENNAVVIDFNANLLTNPTELDETLIHEFIHVLEFFNGHEAFSVKEVNCCCAMVQTISKGLAQMIGQLRQV